MHVQEISGTTGARADADWRHLLSYYAATQRLDPRGAVEEHEDRHEVSWQLFQCAGSWWNAAELRLASAFLPLRQRVARSYLLARAAAT